MRVKGFSKTLLLLGASTILIACSNGEAKSPETTKAAKVEVSASTKAGSDKTYDAKSKAYEMIEYTTAGQTDEDHLYLEEVLGETALNEVKGWNKRTLDRLKSDPRYDTFYNDALEILNSKDKIPYVSYRNDEVHNFWQDADHVRGVWRKSTLDSYLSGSTKWETVLDFDDLAKAEDKNWVYKGNNCLGPKNEICMIVMNFQKMF